MMSTSKKRLQQISIDNMLHTLDKMVTNKELYSYMVDGIEDMLQMKFIKIVAKENMVEIVDKKTQDYFKIGLGPSRNNPNIIWTELTRFKGLKKEVKQIEYLNNNDVILVKERNLSNPVYMKTQKLSGIEVEEEYRVYFENSLAFHQKTNSSIENDIYMDTICRTESERAFISGNRAVSERSYMGKDGVPHICYLKTGSSNLPGFNTRELSCSCYINSWEDATGIEFIDFVKNNDKTLPYRGKPFVKSKN